MVSNGFHEPRRCGAVPVRQPRANDKRLEEESGERYRFSFAILPVWARKSPGMAAVIPLLYLHGLPCDDFVPALAQLLGSTAGLSAATINQDLGRVVVSGVWLGVMGVWCLRILGW